ncbi:aminotransferase class III-fold pyridoxal phosphate-dependent enzyme [Streptomyces sp. SID4928]|uniref:aminotransferase family protein n=1 Tax=unclassified Streptomyces TaxID=2593676 RepID=UPI0001C19C2A|nr:aspartate aminotransferase family protein [Streptomyces sp. ACT-1]EGE39616.1 Adenosylmethionine--8-amino-7-oxononanoate transaminase [Streptomyces sp. ACT-1]MYR47705.1 aminotransferase class III-fold pyridoxal phosphate-dependent enzyme [Streptomyces sp. SID4928]
MTDYPLIHPFTQAGTEAPLVVASARGSYLFDAEGRSYLDGVSSLWNANLGHRNAPIAEAIRAQLDKVDYSTLFGLAHEPALEFAELLTGALPTGMDRVFLTSGGSEAVESALKFAMIRCRARHGTETVPHVVHLENAYHGVSLGALSAMGLPGNRALFEPLLPTFHQAPSPYPYRFAHGRAPEEFAAETADAIGDLIDRIEGLNPDGKVAAVLVETVQGAGGILTPPAGYLRRVSEICAERGVSLVVDEVATGFWRTGDNLFACEAEDVVPDFLTFGKAASGGYVPLGGVVVGQNAYDDMQQLVGNASLPHGFTYGGAPLACAAGVAALRQYLAPGFGTEVRRKAAVLGDHATALATHPAVGDVRHRGMMIGFEIVRDRTSREPFPATDDIVRKIVAHARGLGLIIRPVGNNTVPLMPPLTSTDEELGHMVTLLAKAVDAVTVEAGL